MYFLTSLLETRFGRGHRVVPWAESRNLIVTHRIRGGGARNASGFVYSSDFGMRNRGTCGVKDTTLECDIQLLRTGEGTDQECGDTRKRETTHQSARAQLLRRRERYGQGQTNIILAVRLSFRTGRPAIHRPLLYVTSALCL